jgi:hypothetical protein
MKRLTRIAILSWSLGVASVMATAPAFAEKWPMVAGDFWDVTGIHLKDGGSLGYATFLAGEWRANQEFAKSKGWIKGYTVLSNNYPREGEPDLYLITITDRLVTGAEGEKRSDEYMEWRKKSLSQMQKESGDRVEIREVGGNLLLQELTFR